MRAVEVAEVAGELAAHALLDVRDEEAFRRGHLSGSGHLPLAELAERRSELPPRDAKLLVVGADGAQAHDGAQALESLGYSQVVWLDAAAERCAPGLLDSAPAVPLWRPSPFLEHVRPRLPDPSRVACRVLDLAAGAGRESVWMALQGYAVEAWDHDRGALDKAAALARRHGVAISTEVRNLEVRDPRLPIEVHDVVMVFRFLHRPLFSQIARAVVPDGWVVYETYLRGQERFGRPKHPRFLLDSGELPRHFPGFEVVDYQELTPESGPMLARLLARKTGPSSDPRLAP